MVETWFCPNAAYSASSILRMLTPSREAATLSTSRRACRPRRADWLSTAENAGSARMATISFDVQSASWLRSVASSPIA